MILVADCSALIALSICNSLELLEQVFSQVIVPEAVYLEATQPNKKHAHELKLYLEGKVRKVDMQHYVFLDGFADAGETEAMLLYKQIDADKLLIDDQRGRNVAKINHIETIGSLGVLLVAKQRGLINEIAVITAVQFLVPVGFEKAEWQKLAPVERFYLKMAEMEHQGSKSLDNYINFAKAFQVHHYDQLMSDSSKANAARLKLSTEFKAALMSGDAEIAPTPLRALLYALHELSKEIEIDDVLLHLMDNCVNYAQTKGLLAKMADYLAEKRGSLKATKTFQPDVEASAARVLAEAIRNQRL